MICLSAFFFYPYSFKIQSICILILTDYTLITQFFFFFFFFFAILLEHYISFFLSHIDIVISTLEKAIFQQAKLFFAQITTMKRGKKRVKIHLLDNYVARMEYRHKQIQLYLFQMQMYCFHRMNVCPATMMMKGFGFSYHSFKIASAYIPFQFNAPMKKEMR